MNASLTADTATWYPVCTYPRAEKKASQALLNKGIKTYLPLRKQLKQWSDRKKWVEEPFIKSYLFVNIRPHEQGEVLMTRGIARFIYFSGKVATIDDRQIEELRLLMDSAIELEITEENLQPGERVLIKAGALKGMRGEVVNYRSQKQLAMRLDGIGHSIIIHVGAELLERF